MAITSPLSITFRGLTVGGSTDFPISGPYMLERTYERFLCVFNIVVVADDYATLVSRSTTIEERFGSRLGYDAGNNDLVIALDGNSFTYEHGKTIFNAESTVTKSGDPTIDGPLSRLYTVRIQGELPEASGGGLREFEVVVSQDETRCYLVTMRGTYFAKSDGTANGYSQYNSEFDGVATSYLNFVGDAEDFELVSESFNIDRNRQTDSGSLPDPHKCNFERQYREVKHNQVQGTLNDNRIVNHRMSFSNQGNFRDNGRDDVQRLSRVTVTYDSALDATTNPDPKQIAEEVILPYMISEFQTLYSPNTFCVEQKTAAFDPAQFRLTVNVTIAFVPSGTGDDTILEAQESVQYRENRTIDYTYVHGGEELNAYAHAGFGVKERIWSRQITCVGEQSAVSRMFPNDGGGQPGAANVIGPWTSEILGEAGLDSGEYKHDTVQEEGWNTVTSTSTVIPMFMGEIDGERIIKTTLVESAVQRFTKKPQTGTSAGPSGPSQ